MAKPPDPGFLDDLWYFDSVVSRPMKREKSRGRRDAAKAPEGLSDATPALNVTESGQLPVSTNGDRSLASAGLSPAGDGVYGAQEGEAAPAAEDLRNSSDGCRPSITHELVDKMGKGTGELSFKELDLWMAKLGLEYTEDRAMVRRVPNSELSSQQRLDFSEFVCVNRFIADGRHNQPQASSSFSDAHMASLHEVFDLFDRDDNGLISPAELRGALAKLGLISHSSA